MKINIKIFKLYRIIMFNFEKLSNFDFNRIYESTVHHLNFSLDDFDDEDVDIT